MASVTGSRLAFFDGVGGKTVNVVVTPDGSGVPAPVTGDFNIEVFTSVAGGIAPGYDASAFIQGAVTVAGTSNEVQAGTPTSTEQLLDNSFVLLDRKIGGGPENIQIVGSGAGGTSDTVIGTAGDTITGSAVASNSQLIDASGLNSEVTFGAMTVTGGAGATTVWAGASDVITGGSGPITVAGDGSNNPAGYPNANNVTITGGAGNLQAFNFGTGDSVTGSTAGTTFLGDGYANGGGNTLIGGGGTTTIIAGANDSITGGSGAALITGAAGDTIRGGGGPTTITGSTGDSVTGGAGSVQYNNGTNSTFVGGAGNVFAFDFGTGNHITGSSGAAANSFINDSYTNPTSPGSFTGGTNTITGGAGPTTIIAGPGDVINSGGGTLEARIGSDVPGTETVNLSVGSVADGVRDDSAAGGAGANVMVNHFNTTDDTIQSATSVVGTTFQGTSTVSSGNTVLSFLDGSTMTIVGVTSGIKFST